MKRCLFEVLILCSWALPAFAEEIHFYHPDSLGSMGIVTDRDGGIAEQTFYSPYGELLHDERLETRNPSEFQYTGQEKDSASDLYDDGARYYDPALSQFSSVDPVEGNLPYTYANNNPAIFIDPDGKDPGLYSPEVYPKVLDYRADHAGEDPSVDLVKQWQEALELKSTLATIVFLGVGQRRGTRKIPMAKLLRTYLKTGRNAAGPSLTEAAEREGLSAPVLRYRLSAYYGDEVIDSRTGPRPPFKLGQALAAIDSADGNLTEAARILSQEVGTPVTHSAIRRALAGAKISETETLYDVMNRQYQRSPGVNLYKELTWEEVGPLVEYYQGNLSAAARELGVDHKTVRYHIENNYPGGMEAFRLRFGTPKGGRPANKNKPED